MSPTVISVLALVGCLRGPVVEDPDPTGGTPTADTASPPRLPDPPVVTLTTDFRALVLSWPPSARVDQWRVSETLRNGSPELVATLPTSQTALQLDVALVDHYGATYVVEACNELGCVPSEDVDVGFDLSGAVGRIRPDIIDPGDGFGVSVALCGDSSRLAVGAPGEDSAGEGIDGDPTRSGARGSGAAYLFARTPDGDWAPEAYVKASNTAQNTSFGSSVALSRDCGTLVVGSPFENSADAGIDADGEGAMAIASGAAYVFVDAPGFGWRQMAFLKGEEVATSDRYGWSLAVSADGQVVAVGAPGRDEGGMFDTGAVWVYTRGGGQWRWSDTLTPPTPAGGEVFGEAIAIDDAARWMVVGAPGHSPVQPPPTARGAALVFERPAGDDWIYRQRLTHPHPTDGDELGEVVAMSGDGSRLAVGVPKEDSDDVGIGGDGVDDDAENSGAVLVFRQQGGAWQPDVYLKASNTGPDDAFGSALAFDQLGQRLVVGAPGDDSSSTDLRGSGDDQGTPDAGAAYVFGGGAEGWSQLALLKGPEPTSGHRLGASVGTSTGGHTIAVGVPFHSGLAGGIGAGPTPLGSDDDRAGAVLLY